MPCEQPACAERKTTTMAATPREALVHVVEEGRGGEGDEEEEGIEADAVPPDHRGMAGLVTIPSHCDIMRSGWHAKTGGTVRISCFTSCRLSPPELFPRGEHIGKKPKTGGAESHSRRQGESSPRLWAVWVWVWASVISDPAGRCFQD